MTAADDNVYDFEKLWLNRKNQPPPAKPAAPRKEFINADDEHPYTRKALEDLEDFRHMPPDSGRNAQLNKLAGSLGRVTSITRERLVELLIEACQANGLWQEDGERQCMLTINSGLGYAVTQPPRGPTDDYVITPAYTIDPSEIPPAPTAVSPAGGWAVDDIDGEFWESRESLKMVYQTSMAALASPWAVLGIAAARALTMVHPSIVLPPVIGGPGSLNLFVAIAAQSGGGKGAAGAAAKILVPEQIVQRNAGSGEGFVNAYVRPRDKDDPFDSGLYEGVMFNVDEVDTLAALSQRSASTTMSILRSGFSGETLGFSYATPGKNRHIEAHTYRMTLVVSVQPEKAGGLLKDSGGGTPQRFIWFPATDMRGSIDRPEPTGPLMLPSFDDMRYSREIKIPDAARDLIISERVKNLHGQMDALDGHSLFVREKFAYALAILDGRVEMTLEDWDLSGIAMQVSDRVRQSVIAQMTRALEDVAVEEGRLQGVRSHESEQEKTYRMATQRGRVKAALIKHLSAAGSDGLAQNSLREKVPGRDRGLVKLILEELLRDDVVESRSEGRSTIWILKGGVA